MNLSLRVAWRFLKSNKSQTLLIILGISIGISVQVFVGILIQSLQESLVNSTIGNSSHITVLPDQGVSSRIDGYEGIIEKLEEFDSMRAVSIASDSNALTNVSGVDYSILVRGFELDKADKIYEIKDNIIKGKIPENPNEVIVGKEFSQDLEVEVGEEFYIQGQGQEINDPVQIVGVYDLNVKSINEKWVITTLATSQEIFAEGNNTVTSIETQLDEDYIFEADTIAEEVESDLDNDELKIQNWKDQNQELLSGLQGQSISSYFIQIFVIMSVVIGISSVLAITVLQKSRQLGILKAMGITNKKASMIFLFEGLIFGICGALGGVSLGLFLLAGFNFGTGGSVITLSIDPIFIIISGLISIIACVIAALLPAVKSSKLDPIDIIRGE
ncbi:MAG: FtsX-like permease family protein [Promethearchaeia archaeon]